MLSIIVILWNLENHQTLNENGLHKISQNSENHATFLETRNDLYFLLCAMPNLSSFHDFLAKAMCTFSQISWGKLIKKLWITWQKQCVGLNKTFSCTSFKRKKILKKYLKWLECNLKFFKDDGTLYLTFFSLLS